MIVLIDGKEVECLNDVKVIWTGHEDSQGQHIDSHLTLTYEGAIFDKVSNEAVSNEGYVEQTQSIEYEDLFAIMLNDPAE